MKQLLKSLRLQRLKDAYGFTDEECKLYGFSRGDNLNRAADFMSQHLFNQIYRRALHRGKQWHLLDDKWVTERFLGSLNFPVPKTHGVFHPRFGWTADGQWLRTPEQLTTLLRSVGAVPLILKPRGGRMGNHILAIEPVISPEEVQIRDAKGLWSVQTFLNRLPADAFNDFDGEYHGWLIQDRVRQHPDLNQLNPDSLNTIRLISFLTLDGDCEIHYGLIRIGRKGSIVDNWTQGGLSVVLDLDTGTLGSAIIKPKATAERIHHHPDSGFQFDGFQIPLWSKVTDLIKQAATTVSGVRSVGWDIALSEDGPLIIEANATWGIRSVQSHTDDGCLTPHVRAELAKYGAVFPIKPPPLAGFLWRLVRGKLNVPS